MSGVLHFVYLPAEEFTLAQEQGLLDLTTQPDHADYRREVQRSLNRITSTTFAPVKVVHIEVVKLRAYADRTGKNPAARQTRIDYGADATDARTIAWPPSRNAACWCGSRRKYKMCCGAPSFVAAALPDPARLILRLELEHTDPPVWRRLAVPSQLRLDLLHEVIQTAMGWQAQHLYLFETPDGLVTDPQDRKSDDASADEVRLVEVVQETGESFRYLYDFGDDWWHTLTLEEVRPAEGNNRSEILDGGGACPPENCGGAPGYRHLVGALTDSSHPDHDFAVDQLGAGFDVAAYVVPRERTGGVAAQRVAHPRSRIN